MRKVLLIVGAVLVPGATAVHAGGMNLAVGTGCWSENPVNTKTWACDTNVGIALQMTVSFQLDYDMPEMESLEIRMYGESDSATLPKMRSLM